LLFTGKASGFPLKKRGGGPNETIINGRKSKEKSGKGKRKSMSLSSLRKDITAHTLLVDYRERDMAVSMGGTRV